MTQQIRSALADLRVGQGLTQETVAGRMGITYQAVGQMERRGPGTLRPGTLARYVEALGGQLTITAQFGTGRVSWPIEGKPDA